MTEAQFFAGITGSDNDLARVVAAFRVAGQPFCLIGGLAVNHYSDPVVTLDADFAIASSAGVVEALQVAGFIVQSHLHSINATIPGSRLRIQITVNDRYGGFPSRAIESSVFGVRMPVAVLEDIIKGKLWAATDPNRRASKRLKDRLDLTRICETHPNMVSLIPEGMVPEVDLLRECQKEEKPGRKDEG